MTRVPVSQGLFGLAATVAIFKGLKEAMNFYSLGALRLNVSDGNMNPTMTAESHTVTKKIVTTVTATINTGTKQKLDWPLVLDFVLEELDMIDPRIWIATIALCVLGPVAVYLFDGRRSVFSTNTHSTQTDEVEEVRIPDLPGPSSGKGPSSYSPYFQYNPAERAWMQFGKSKSEPFLFTYVPISYSTKDSSSEIEQEVKEYENEPSLEFCDKQVAEPATDNFNREESATDNYNHDESAQSAQSISDQLPSSGNKFRSIQEKKSLHVMNHQQQHLLEDREVSSLDESFTINPFDKRPISSNSSHSIPSSRSSPMASSVLNSSNSHLRLQMSPTKTFTHLSSELAYSQPFSY
ncbi:hypothetical protein HG535_0E01480 [Zygotorulaspora mrakii]|uniref:Uncharacterized protein n=1 Tax=Zygotorulaspora mrakii TaxID=42260 RepID=A0A7H9B3T0_ZYGMR|nr:uncharacterized protein HG535_0E01480 [Zygotorulaspora mrakii]QLG73064.1 hypothetical protein HG535_0E01480 [Zygotorulaspora mrakii]